VANPLFIFHYLVFSPVKVSFLSDLPITIFPPTMLLIPFFFLLFARAQDFALFFVGLIFLET